MPREEMVLDLLSPEKNGLTIHVTFRYREAAGGKNLDLILLTNGENLPILLTSLNLVYWIYKKLQM